jgi:GTP pyrophosphokinase
MVLAMVDDVRVIMVKLADRLHNMRTLEHLDPERQRKIAKETFEIYAPIANRLGMGKIKSELEDLALRYSDPIGYRNLVRKLEKKRSVSDAFIAEIRQSLDALLKEQGIEAEISGRIKSAYSIYRKIQTQKIDVDEVYDYVAFRIITNSVRDCYGALGIVHSHWRPIPGRIKDFIAISKPNGYRSLHTSVVSERGQPFEVQIRSHEMHRVAQEGVAAHWRYKEGRVDEQDAESARWLRHLMDWQQDVHDAREFRELVKVDLYPEDVYAFTPKGKVLSFPRGATPVDFAYAIHTDVGHHCSGARVNGRIVPLKTPLQNGDIVEILTASGHHPSRDWLNLVKTARARGKIRAWIHTHERVRSVALGRELVEKELRRYKLSLKTVDGNGTLRDALDALNFQTIDDFYAATGYGKVTAFQLVSKLAPAGNLEERKESFLGRAVRRALGISERKVRVRGIEDVMVYLARCCHPIRGDEIVGYITRGKGVSVHSVACRNVVNLLYAPDRRIEVEWEAGGDDLYEVKLAIRTVDRQGILARVVSTISDEKTNIRNVDAKSLAPNRGLISLSLDIKDRAQMDRVIARLRKIDGIEHVERVVG